MSILIKLIGGRQLFVEFARWARPGGRWTITREGSEWIIWIGRLHLIYTPPWRCRYTARGIDDERSSRALFP
jgi:hypothetical protein